MKITALDLSLSIACSWPVYSAKSNELLEMRSDGSVVGEPDPKQARLDVMEKAATKLLK